MRKTTGFLLALPILVALFSCWQSKQQEITSHKLSVVEAKGYTIPADSLQPAQVIPVSETDLKISPVTGTEPVATNTNIHAAISDKILSIGEPVITIPGKDSFLLPVVSAAMDSQISVGPREIVMAKDMAIKDPNPANFSYLGKLQGVKHISINALIQDQAGNLWIGSRGGGLSRFDGQTFTHFANIPALASNRVISLIEAKDGNMWFGSEKSGLFKYDGKKFMRLLDSNRSMSPLTRTIMQDHAGNIWIGTDRNGMFKYDGKNFTQYSTKQGLSGNDVAHIIEDKKGNLWIATDNGVNKFDGAQFKQYTTQTGLPDNSIRCLLEDKRGNIWMGTDSAGIIKYDGQQFINYTKNEGLSSNTIATMLEDKFGNIWLGTEGTGAVKFNGTEFTHYDTDQGFPNKSVRCMLEDRSGNIWFGNYGALAKLSGIPFTHFTDKEGLLFSQNWSILEDKKNNIWFGSSAGLCKYDGKYFTSYTAKNGMPFKSTVRSISMDHHGNILIGASDGGGMAKFDGKQFIYFKDPFGDKSNGVQDLIEDRHGNIWLANYKNGLYKFDGKALTVYTTKQGMPSNSANCLTEDRNGNIWICTSDAGIAKYDGKQFTTYDTKDGLPANAVWTSLEDRAGNLWFGTERGAARYDGKYFTAFTEKEGMAGNYPLTTTEDHDGNIWFVTRNGINKLPKEKARQSYLEVRSNESGVDGNMTLINSFEYADGFLGMGGQSGKTILTDHNGIIWACSNDRVSVFNTANELKDIEPPRARLTGISLYEEPINWNALSENKDSSFILANGVNINTAKIRFDSLVQWQSYPANLSLPYNNNYLTFNFTGITMYQPGKVKYQYILEGNDKNWSTLTSSTKASYSNLSPGKYTFKVKAMNSQGKWSNEFAYSFTVRPPWWSTWWAYALYALLAAGAIAAFVRYRSRMLIRENTILEFKVEKRTAELNQTIRELKTTQSQLIQSEKMASLGELTAGIAHEIQNPLNFVNNFSEVNKELVDELQQELKAGNYDDAIAISNDIKENEDKISHHGKRADAIVKGMLQHSRTSSGQKEPTDINTLCNEYLRLAYHGLRAKDKSFNAKTQTDFDSSISPVNIVPQDIGRVVLNLLNNAFYVVDEKRKQSNGHHAYQPTVTIATKRSNGHIEIKIADNGNGVPQKVLDKIFQPFFTTKPAGAGTGLGLSLSYDIVKAHGGDLKVETKEAEGSEFVVTLPA